MTSEQSGDKQFGLYELLESDVEKSPIAQFDIWFKAACETDIIHPNAFALSTSTKEGIPSSRMLLLKDFDEEGFVFYSNCESKKGGELTENNHSAICFWWGKLERQVRIQGTVTRVADQEADEYFHTRPRGSQIGAWASAQSTVIPDRKVLDLKYSEIEEKYKDMEIPRPPYWIGYRLSPLSIEFWQGRLNRLHDRLRYTKSGDGDWVIERLAP